MRSLDLLLQRFSGFLAIQVQSLDGLFFLYHVVESSQFSGVQSPQDRAQASAASVPSSLFFEQRDSILATHEQS